MINTDRIIPILKIDRLSLVGETMKLIGTSFTKLTASDVAGNFTVTGTGDAGNKLANQPAASIDFATGVTAGVVYFVPAADFAGFKIAGTAVTATGDVDADGVSLYTATLSSGSITVAKITP